LGGVSTNSASTRMQDHRNTPVAMGSPSTKELFDFAEWAFGPAGFPKLLVLAYGDFTHYGRFGWTNILLCRNSHSKIPVDDAATSTEALLRLTSFRIMAQNDEYLWDQIEKGREMLSACPTEQSLDFDSDANSSDYSDDLSNDL
jgi:hypothetical protein